VSSPTQDTQTVAQAQDAPTQDTSPLTPSQKALDEPDMFDSKEVAVTRERLIER